MKLTYTTANGRMNVEFESDQQRGIFEELAKFQEVFENSKCGKCGCEDLRFVVRTDADDNKYYELRCTNPKCRAKLAFGANKKGGGLFPKRKDADNNWLPDGGWVKWNPETQKEE